MSKKLSAQKPVESSESSIQQGNNYMIPITRSQQNRLELEYLTWNKCPRNRCNEIGRKIGLEGKIVSIWFKARHQFHPDNVHKLGLEKHVKKPMTIGFYDEVNTNMFKVFQRSIASYKETTSMFPWILHNPPATVIYAPDIGYVPPKPPLTVNEGGDLFRPLPVQATSVDPDKAPKNKMEFKMTHTPLKTNNTPISPCQLPEQPNDQQNSPRIEPEDNK